MISGRLRTFIRSGPEPKEVEVSQATPEAELVVRLGNQKMILSHYEFHVLASLVEKFK